MIATIKFFLVCIVVVSFHTVNAQEKKSNDSLNFKPDFRPTGLRLGVDVISPIKSKIRTNFTGWEFNGDVDFHRYLLNAEIGSWGRNFKSDSASYKNNGTYWRAGIDVNFLTRDPDRNVFFLGFRYARSNYSEQTTYTVDDQYWGVINGNASNGNVNTRWLELTMGLKVKIYKFIWLGYTSRLKFGLKKNLHNAMLSSDVPGYGRTDKDNTFGFNYYVMFRIPFRQAGSILPPLKKK
jgi:hypothetical protein